MRNRCVAAVLFAWASSQAAYPAEAPKPAPRMTGQEFVERFLNSANTRLGQETPRLFIERELALGYIAGAADATQGTQWCDKGLVKTTEIDAEIAHALQKLPPAALQRNAGTLIVELLKKRFPCH